MSAKLASHIFRPGRSAGFSAWTGRSHQCLARDAPWSKEMMRHVMMCVMSFLDKNCRWGPKRSEVLFLGFVQNKLVMWEFLGNLFFPGHAYQHRTCAGGGSQSTGAGQAHSLETHWFDSNFDTMAVIFRCHHSMSQCHAKPSGKWTFDFFNVCSENRSFFPSRRYYELEDQLPSQSLGTSVSQLDPWLKWSQSLWNVFFFLCDDKSINDIHFCVHSVSMKPPKCFRELSLLELRNNF